MKMKFLHWEYVLVIVLCFLYIFQNFSMTKYINGIASTSFFFFLRNNQLKYKNLSISSGELYITGEVDDEADIVWWSHTIGHPEY